VIIQIIQLLIRMINILYITYVVLRTAVADGYSCSKRKRRMEPQECLNEVSLSSPLINNSTTVAVPAAVWLFGSGLLGLVGIARRQKAA